MRTDVGDIVAEASKAVLDYDQFCQSAIFQGLTIKPLTKRLIHTLLLDLPLPPPVVIDFGITSPAHYRALKDALFYVTEECDMNREPNDKAVGAVKSCTAFRRRIVELDAAYGNAAELDAFVKRNAPVYADRVYFEPTEWDYLYGRVEEDSQR